jgi:monovalent cation:H+ antiporter-2, CPA2 family
MLLLIVGGMFLVWSMVVWLFRYPVRIAILVAAGLTQIGELSFVVMQAARPAGMVAENLFSTVIAASLISILLNVFIVRGTFALLGRLAESVTKLGNHALSRSSDSVAS